MGMVTAIALFWSNKPNPAIWLGWAYLTKTVRKPQRGGVNFDPPMIFCACSMQNEPHESKADHTSFYVISKLFTQTFLIGRGNATFLYIAYVKSTKNVGKLTCVFGRFKNPFFLWLIQILKAVTMIMVTAIAFFWSFMRNPAIRKIQYRRANVP